MVLTTQLLEAFRFRDTVEGAVEAVAPAVEPADERVRPAGTLGDLDAAVAAAVEVEPGRPGPIPPQQKWGVGDLEALQEPATGMSALRPMNMGVRPKIVSRSRSCSSAEV